MPKNKKIWAVIILIAVAVAAVLVGLQAYKNQGDRTIKIGVILPLTGDLASLGEAAKNAALLAYSDLPARQKNNAIILFEDDHFDPKTTVTAFNKLVDVDRVSAVVCLTSGPCAAIAQLAEQRQIPLIAIASNPKIQQDKKFVFRLEIAPSQEAKALLSYMNSRGFSKIASIIAVQDGILAGYDAIHSYVLFNSKEVDSETVAPDQKDFRTAIAKILSKKPDVILVGLLPGMAGEFGKQARTLGYKYDFVGFNFLEGQETLTTANGALDGIVYTSAQAPQNWFAKKYMNLPTLTGGVSL